LTTHLTKCSSLDKVRIIALYILFREGVADEDRRRLYQHARLSISEQDTINNLIYLGINVIKVSLYRYRHDQRLKVRIQKSDLEVPV
jgi:syntaxin-binding protein 1